MHPGNTRTLLVAGLMALPLSLVSLAATGGEVSPGTYDDELYPGTSVIVEKTVTTDEIPPNVDICLLEDETGSFFDDISNLQTAASALYDSIVAASPAAQFGVAGFRDYPVGDYGSPGDWVYRLLSPMSAAKADWLAGVGSLTAGGGADGPEAQYDAIVASVVGGFGYANCGWRDDAAVQRVLVVATDAPFHGPDGTHVNDLASTLAVLDTAGVAVVGLKAPGAAGELDALAAATGGSVQALGSDGANIAAAILAGLAEITTDVWGVPGTCDLDISLDPAVHEDIAGGESVVFTETIAVPNDTAPGTYECDVVFWANGYPEEGTEIGTQTVTIEVVPIPVFIDIKPTSCPNPLNVNLKGVLPVAILGTADLDVTTIDPESILLEGVAPLRWTYEDVATPYTGDGMDRMACTTAGPDGYLDLVLHFESQDVSAAIAPVADGDVMWLELTGNFLDGRAIAGQDVVWILQKK